MSTSFILDRGFATCKQWSIGPTMQAFLDGVTRALIWTPAFSLLALLAFLRDAFLCYAALYTILGVIITVMGLLDLLGLSLGPIESLSFAVVIGVSVDYLTHFAYAYKHSLMHDQYFKTRATFLARSASVTASAVTTLCAVLPLLAALLTPLRLFGIIFTVVALVSVVFSMCVFPSLLAVAGPGKALDRDAVAASGAAAVSVLAQPITQSRSFHLSLSVPMGARAGLAACADAGACTAAETDSNRASMRERAVAKI